ncbi:Adenosine deaminase, partial [Gryllus bimaculatus]
GENTGTRTRRTNTEKNFPLPGDGTLEAVRNEILARSPLDASVHYGQAIPFYMQAFANDMDAIERMAYEFCEDKVEQGVLYVEARYVPHRMMCYKLSPGRTHVELCEIVSAVNRGFRSAERTLGIVVRSILVVIVGTGIAGDVISLCQ